jgi:hypothetical protein
MSWWGFLKKGADPVPKEPSAAERSAERLRYRRDFLKQVAGGVIVAGTGATLEKGTPLSEVKTARALAYLSNGIYTYNTGLVESCGVYLTQMVVPGYGWDLPPKQGVRRG